MKNNGRSTDIKAILQALLVTFLWSTSFVIIKKGLLDISPITFAGLRYGLAWFFFLPIILHSKHKSEIKNLTKLQWKKLILLGLVFYTFTQGAQFLGLYYLPSVTVSLMLNFTPIIVAVMGIFMLNEKPTIIQWCGTGIFLLGILTFFFPISIAGSKALGLSIMGFGVLANAGATIIGRSVNRDKDIHPIIITFISMGIGAAILLVIGLIANGIPIVSIKNWIYLFWLAGVNTAFAFTLWNHTMRSLTAMESSIINGTMLIQIAILAWVFLGESITYMECIGMSIAAIGALLVQMKRKQT